MDSETSQSTFRKMAVCVKCEIEDGLEDISFNRRGYGGRGRRCYEFHINGFPDTIFFIALNRSIT